MGLVSETSHCEGQKSSKLVDAEKLDDVNNTTSDKLRHYEKKSGKTVLL